MFAFLGNTTRLYGSVAHYIRAINTRTVTASSGWQVDDKSIDGKGPCRLSVTYNILDFLDSVIGGLVAAEGGTADENSGLEK